MRLAGQLLEHFAIDTHFLACSQAGLCDPPGHGRTSLAHPTGACFLAAVRGIVATRERGSVPVVMVLHYVGYGFDPSGAPTWLARAVEELVRRKEVRVVTFFHEIYATSMPWRRAFWHSIRQRAVARRLQRASAVVICSTARNEAVLRKWSRNCSLARAAIPSNVGEPRDPIPPWEARRRDLVVFGRHHTRQLAYRNAATMSRLCKALDVARLVDIGPGDPALPELAETAVLKRGVLPAGEISEALAGARFAYLDYPAESLAKSGIFAACTAHGVVTIIANVGDGTRDGLVAGRHYVDSRAILERHAIDFGLVSREARAWYARHDSLAHARLVGAAVGCHGSHAFSGADVSSEG